MDQVTRLSITKALVLNYSNRESFTSMGERRATLKADVPVSSMQGSPTRLSVAGRQE